MEPSFLWVSLSLSLSFLRSDKQLPLHWKAISCNHN